MKKWLKERIEDIQWHWNDKIGTLHSWWDNLCRIVDFIPVLWHDWDFDARPGLYRYMRKKLERLEPCLRNGCHVNGERDARRVQVAISVLDRIIADEYEEKELAPHDEKWGKCHFSFEPDEVNGVECYRMNTDREHVVTEEDEEQEREEYIAHIHSADAQRERDIKWVFAFIARWHRHWWD